MFRDNQPVCRACGNWGEIQTVGYSDGDIFLCRVCRIQWAVDKGQPALETVEYNFYMESRSFGSTDRYPPFQHFFRRLRNLSPGKKTLRILDVGCGAGIFLQEALRRDHECLGIEADEKLKNRMSLAIQDRVRFGRAESVFLEGEFDVICFWDSFEHFPDPFALLTRLKANLAADGMFYLRTNHNFDIYNVLSQVLLATWPQLGRAVFRSCFHRPIHYWNFSREGLSGLLKTVGLSIREFSLDETPASRLSPNPLVQAVFKLAYALNRAIGGGKICNVYASKIP